MAPRVASQVLRVDSLPEDDAQSPDDVRTDRSELVQKAIAAQAAAFEEQEKLIRTQAETIDKLTGQVQELARKLAQYESGKGDESNASTAVPLPENGVLSVVETPAFSKERPNSLDRHSTFARSSRWSRSGPGPAAFRSSNRLITADVQAGIDASADETAEQRRPFWKLPLNPNSPARMIWDIISMTLLMWDLAYIPLQMFDPEDSDFTNAMGWITLIFWTLDVFMSNATGFYQDGALVMSQRAITILYLKTWFALDMVVLLPDWFMRVVGSIQSSGLESFAEIVRGARIMRVVRLVRVLKMKTLLNLVYDLLDSEYMFIVFSVGKMITALLVFNHIIACGFYFVGKMEMDRGQPNWLEHTGMGPVIDGDIMWRYTTALHWSLTQFTPAGMEVVPRNVPERLLSIVVLICALIVFSSVLGGITNSMTALRNMGADTKKQFWLLRRYFNQNHVNPMSRTRIIRYLEHQTKATAGEVSMSDISILSLLSEPLQALLDYEMNKQLIVVHPIFANFEATMPSCMMKLCRNALTFICFANDDAIFGAGDESDKMYFFQKGSLLYTPNHGPPCTVTSGWIVEPVLWTGWWHQGGLRATSPSQLATIKPGPFCEVMKVYSHKWELCRSYAAEFIQMLNSTPEDELTDLAGDFSMLESIVNRCCEVPLGRLSMRSNSKES
eukprot:gb/GFBE01072670.1/.p1 GENE.gb/GFBE01072670.1/~~gb/GFBE01072670.1/.p1  ORF type:complete len:672 (+),score=98.03 gb/GFBE01072670.1/:1-2016(+)